MDNWTYIYILASKGRSLVSLPVKIYQFGFPYTHIAYITNFNSPNYNENDPEVIEAWFPKVRYGKFSEVHTPGTEFSVFGLKVKESQKQQIEDFLFSQVGKWYDVIGLLTFVFRWKKLAKNKFWFCSELVFSALKSAGIEILRYTDPMEVTPALFLKSPLLEKVYDSALPGKKRNVSFVVTTTWQFR